MTIEGGKFPHAIQHRSGSHSRPPARALVGRRFTLMHSSKRVPCTTMAERSLPDAVLQGIAEFCGIDERLALRAPPRPLSPMLVRNMEGLLAPSRPPTCTNTKVLLGNWNVLVFNADFVELKYDHPHLDMSFHHYRKTRGEEFNEIFAAYKMERGGGVKSNTHAAVHGGLWASASPRAVWNLYTRA